MRNPDSASASAPEEPEDLARASRTFLDGLESVVENPSDDNLRALLTAAARIYGRLLDLADVDPATSDELPSVLTDEDEETLLSGLQDALSVVDGRRLGRLTSPDDASAWAVPSSVIYETAANLVYAASSLEAVCRLIEDHQNADALWAARFGFWSEWGHGLLRAMAVVHVLVSPELTLLPS